MTTLSDQRLDQVVKGAPPPNVSPTQIASAVKKNTPRPGSAYGHDNIRPSSSSITAPREPAPAASSHLDALPSSPPQIYLNLLILESSLRLQYLSLRARLRLHILLFTILTLWTTTFTWLLFYRPREDGNGVGGSVYWVLESSEKLCWTGGLVTAGLFWGTGMWERGVRWPRKFVGTTNRGLRGFNLKIVLVRRSVLHEVLGWVALLDPLGWYGDNRHVNFQFVPRDLDVDGRVATTSSLGGSTPGDKDPWQHPNRHDWVEEDIAPAGDTIKLLLLPKPFSPDFREGWDTYRIDYWSRENARRAELRRLIKVQQRQIARRQGGWLWWTGWRGWDNFTFRRSVARGGGRDGRSGISGLGNKGGILGNPKLADTERTSSALKDRSSTERLRSSEHQQQRRKRDSLLRGESHSRSSSRSSTNTPTPEPAGDGPRIKPRRGSSTTRPRTKKLSSTLAGSKLSGTDGTLQDHGSSGGGGVSGQSQPQADGHPQDQPKLNERASNPSLASSSSEGEAAGGGGTRQRERERQKERERERTRDRDLQDSPPVAVLAESGEA